MANTSAPLLSAQFIIRISLKDDFPLFPKNTLPALEQRVLFILDIIVVERKGDSLAAKYAYFNNRCFHSNYIFSYAFFACKELYAK